MPTSLSIDAVRIIRTANDGALTDADLLGRFIDHRDETAFALLVRRHGPMVYGVCRRVLPTDQDAEDAFQATFLVLVEKARMVIPREAVGNWLYGVARRAALLARRGIVRRRERMGDMPEYPAAAPDPLNDLRVALDEELSRLPDHYRGVIVLCDLEGRTRREAAALLGCPEGTVAGRLARAREMLAKKLARHAPAVSVAALLTSTASARMPEVPIRIESATGSVAALTREILGVMLRGKLMKTATVVFLALSCAGFGMFLQAGQKDADAPKPVFVEPGERDVKLSIKAEGVAWGDEVDGVRAGLALTPADAVRPGEQIKLVVRLQNVSKAVVTINYSSAPLDDNPPQIVNATGTRVPVLMPPIKLYKRRSMQRALQPGETIELASARIAVEGERAEKPGDPDAHVETPTIHVRPGKYKVALGGFLTSHPKLSTGTAEFEVKDGAKPVAAIRDAFVWGQEVKGLQAGVGFVPTDGRTFRHGSEFKLEVKLRNTSKAAITLTYGLPRESSPQITDSDDKRVNVTMPPMWGFYVSPTERVLKPGETMTLYYPQVAIGSEDLKKRVGPEPLVDTPTIRVREGKYKVALGGFLTSHPKLSTGAAEFEVKDAPPADTPAQAPGDTGRVGRPHP